MNKNEYEKIKEHKIEIIDYINKELQQKKYINDDDFFIDCYDGINKISFSYKLNHNSKNLQTEIFLSTISYTIENSIYKYSRVFLHNDLHINGIIKKKSIFLIFEY